MSTDVLIIGGGMVGATLALALDRLTPNLKVAVVESTPLPEDPEELLQPSYDARATALSYGTRLIYDELELWPQLQELVCPILDIHVSDRGHFGFTRLNHREQDVPALGYVVENRRLGQVLLEACQNLSNLTWICPATVTALEFATDQVEASVETAQGAMQLQAKLVVLADGGRSDLAGQLGLEFAERSYGQQALVTNLSTSKPHNQVAYERFTEEGPMALLPLTEARSALVWTMPEADANRRLAMSDDTFLAEIQERFGYRLGRFTQVGERHTYALSLRQVKEQVRPGLVVLGNAAHVLHPVAGQGYNLCLRDLIALARELAQAHGQQEALGALTVLQRYQQGRERDQRETTGFSDLLVRGFSNASTPLSLVRNLGLVGLDLAPPLKRWFARQTMGLRS